MTFKIKNSNQFYLFFVTILTLNLIISCKSATYSNYKVEGKKIPITNEFKSNSTIDQFVSPYRNHINEDLDIVLSYSDETLDKSKGEFQSNIGNFIADASFELANPIFNKKTNKNIDGVLFNNGGIRSIIAKGNVTKRTAFEVMPFENSLIVVALKGEQIIELATYFSTEKKPHPINGFHIFLNQDGSLSKVTLNTKEIELTKTYYILTSDYLANGGDSMNFFLKNEGKFDLDYKIRNVLIDYFTLHKKINVNLDERVTKLK